MTEQRRNFLLAAGTAIGFMLMTALLFDYYYALNDDVLIKDILAGVQTGSPSGYSVQLLYPVSVLISAFYQLFRNMPWFGFFLCFCHFGSLVLILYRSLCMVKGMGKKAAILFLGVIMAAGLCWWELVFAQYTVTCAVMTGTAAFWLYLTPADLKGKVFYRYHIVTVLLLILAFYIRTEMLMLTLPLVGITGIIRWLEEKQKWQMLKRYAVIATVVLSGMGIGILVNEIAYSGEDWREFNRVFEARTEIYDFYGRPVKEEYEENKEIYEGMGVTERQYRLLENYNLGLDPEIDAELMERVEACRAVSYQEKNPAGTRMREAVWQYAHGLFDFGNQYFQMDLPWNMTVVLLYAMLCVIALFCKSRRILYQLPLLLGARSISWFYILYRGRVVERISHSLYLVEMLILLGMIGAIAIQEKGYRRYWKAAGFAILGAAALACVPGMYGRIVREQEHRAETNIPYELLKEYCVSHPEQYFYVDVEATVDFSEKMFIKTDNSKRNYDIIGGWLCKSPISGQEPLEYFVTEPEEDISWLKAYFEIEEADRIENEKGSLWIIYRRING